MEASWALLDLILVYGAPGNDDQPDRSDGVRGEVPSHESNGILDAEGSADSSYALRFFLVS